MPREIRDAWRAKKALGGHNTYWARVLSVSLTPVRARPGWSECERCLPCGSRPHRADGQHRPRSTAGASLDLLAGAQHPGFHAGDRDAGTRRGFGLRQALDRGELDGAPVGFGQTRDHRRQAGCELGFRRACILGVRLAGQVDFQGVGAAVTTSPPAHRVLERVARDLKQPGFDPISLPQRRQVPHDAQEHLLDHIVGLYAWRRATNARRRQANSLNMRDVSPATPAAITAEGASAEDECAIPPPITFSKTPVLTKGRSGDY